MMTSLIRFENFDVCDALSLERHTICNSKNGTYISFKSNTPTFQLDDTDLENVVYDENNNDTGVYLHLSPSCSNLLFNFKKSIQNKIFQATKLNTMTSSFSKIVAVVENDTEAWSMNSNKPQRIDLKGLHRFKRNKCVSILSFRGVTVHEYQKQMICSEEWILKKILLIQQSPLLLRSWVLSLEQNSKTPIEQEQEQEQEQKQKQEQKHLVNDDTMADYILNECIKSDAESDKTISCMSPDLLTSVSSRHTSPYVSPRVSPCTSPRVTPSASPRASPRNVPESTQIAKPKKTNHPVKRPESRPESRPETRSSKKSSRSDELDISLIMGNSLV